MRIFIVFSFLDCASTSAPPQNSSDNNKTDTQLQSNDNFTEADINEIVALGFSRNQALFELRQFNGDKTQAIAALFAKSLKF